MFNTISISDLQKSPKKILEQNTPFTFILSHNKKQGGVISKKFMHFIEEQKILEAYEHWAMSDEERQLREELWESKDLVTQSIIEEGRANKTEGTDFNEWAKNEI